MPKRTSVVWTRPAPDQRLLLRGLLPSALAAVFAAGGPDAGGDGYGL